MGVGFLLFLRPKFGYLLQNLPANVFYELLEEKIVENKKTKFSHPKQIFFTFFRNTNEYERSPRVRLQTLNRLNGRRHLSSLVQRTAP